MIREEIVIQIRKHILEKEEFSKAVKLSRKITRNARVKEI
jgi:hypothetical protein